MRNNQEYLEVFKRIDTLFRHTADIVPQRVKYLHNILTMWIGKALNLSLKKIRTVNILETILAMFIAIGQIVASNAPNICSGLAPNTFVRNTQNCSTYFECSNGEPKLVKCPGQQLFNSNKRECDAPHNVNCFACPSEPLFIDLPVANECQQFIRCYNKQSKQMTCASGLAFDSKLGVCNLVSRVACNFIRECQPNVLQPLLTRDAYNCSR